MFQIAGEPLNVSATVLGYIGDLPITNTMTMAMLDLVFFLILFILVSRFKVSNPGKFQIVIEQLFEAVTNLITQIIGNSKAAARIVPLVGTLVLFILVSNLVITILPVLTGFTYEGEPLFRSHTNDFNTTVALAFGMIVLVQIYSIRKNNIFKHIFRYIQIPQVIKGFRGGIGSGFIALINAFTGILDIVSELARVVSLSLRLFGNMFAGELLVGVLMTIFALFLPIPIILLATLSGVIQAIVFGSLVASYYGGVIGDEGNEELKS